ncbi:MAG: LPXTG cell wall anchor domain-containing protein [Planctomycetaceae bacterium]|nr:LPXTG cell wall anchor domain-containing protein [Planctomycetaceae bacterium]
MSDKQQRAAERGAAAKQRVNSKLGEIWWAILLRGLLALALALCAFVWPEKTVGMMVKLLGGYLLIDGVIGAIGAYRSGEKSSHLFQAIASLAIGLILLLWSGVSAKLFLVLVGVWLALQGAGLFWSAFKTNDEDGARGLTLSIGGVMTVIGLTFVFWPKTGVVTISWLIGIGALLIGGLLVFLATRVKRLQTRVGEIGNHS